MFPVIEFSYVAEYFFRALLIIFVHQDKWRLLQIEVEHDNDEREWDELEDDGEGEPVQFHNVEEP